MKVSGWDREEKGTDMLARGCDGLIEEDVADVASKLVEKFLVKLLEGWIGRRDERDVRRNGTLLGGNRTEMGQEVRLVVVLFTALAGAVGRVAAGYRRCVIRVESAVYENKYFIENNI
jgi:hypothetical protein